MKTIPVLSLLLFAALAATAVFTNSCGSSPHIDPDAAPRPDAQLDDAGVALHCVPESGTTVVLQEVVRGLSDPLFIDAPKGDPRLFVVEQPGRIVIVKDYAIVPTAFLDVQSIVRDIGNEQGLLGLAFHPQFASNGRFFINYTAASPSGDTVIAEYSVSANPDVANPEGKILLSFSQPQSNHNGGMLAFGPDGFLYIATGDGGGAGDPHNGQIGNGQSLQTHLGKLLRIDVDSGAPYGIPADNPYAAGGGLPEIWAYGLRNPWRFSFDDANGDIYIADVGQGEREEVNVQAGSAAGLNYGWKIMEGTLCYDAATCDMSGLVAPVHDYPHTEGRQSITGGHVYRGACLPDIQGRYFFGDFASGQVYTFEYSDDAISNLQEITSTLDPGGAIRGLTSFGKDGFGELYILSRDGKVFRIVAGS